MAIPIERMPPWDDLCSLLPWELRLIEDVSFGRKRYGYCGVYRLFGLTSEGDINAPAILNRVCGQDTTGTLNIGHAGNLNNRLNQLRRSLLGSEKPHGAYRLKDIPLLEKQFSSNKLAIALLFTGNSPSLVEGDLIKAYMNSFGGTPPLNYRT